MADKSNLPWTTHTGRMREMERAVRAMPDIGAPAFRLFTAVTQGLNEDSGEYYCRDEVMAVACGLKTRQSVSKHRAALKRKRLLDFTPGRPGKATVYRLTLSDERLLDHLALLSDQKREAKDKVESDQPRRRSVNKSLPRKRKEVGPGEAAIDALRKQTTTQDDLPASTNGDAESDVGVNESLPSASTNVDTLHPDPTPPFLSTDAGFDSRGDQPIKAPSSEPVILATIGETFDYIDAHPSEPVTAWTGLADQERGERVINGHLWRLSREYKFTVDEATEIIGDELARMKQAVAEFPGDGDRAGRRMKKLLANARAKRAA